MTTAISLVPKRASHGQRVKKERLVTTPSRCHFSGQNDAGSRARTT